MTKTIRVENADNADYQVVVEVWEKRRDGAPDTKVEESILSHPTAMATKYITSTRYLVVKEVTKISNG